MPRLTHLLALASVALASCQTGPQPRPFAGRGGNNLDKPPRYGQEGADNSSRYVEPIAPEAMPPIDPATAAAAAAAGIDPRTIPPSANTNPPSGYNSPTPPSVDPGLSVAPPTTPTTPTTPPTTPGVNPPTAPGDVPFARAVPGKPGYVFSPKDNKKIISVEGLRPGSKAKDPETGEIFRVPYQ
jgi:hypothetical protein